MRRITWAMAFSVISSVFAGGASATYHTFKFNELYSNPSGTVQFMELKESIGFNFQNFVTQAPDIKSTLHDFVFPADLPSTATANKTFILGTAGYAAIAGVPAPDYIIPANFFNPAGDTIQFGSTGPNGVVDVTTFGALPSAATQSLNRVGTIGNNFVVATNSPTNFAGAAGSVPEPTSGLLLAGTGLRLLLRRRRGN